MPTVARLFIRCLREHGVETCFGIPGGPWIPYLQVMADEGMEFVLVANEATAGFMADVTARLTGKTALCHGTFGPGATNLSTGVGCAYLDRSPLIAATSEMPDAFEGRVAQMHIDHQTLFRPITKKTFRLRPREVGRQVRDALALARSEIPGPVHIGIPTDLAELSAEEEDFTGSDFPESLVSPPKEELDAALNAFSRARRPLLAVGLTAARLGLVSELNRLLDVHFMPVVLTPMAKGILREDHPCYAGVLFHAASDALAPLVAEADLILGVGYDPVEFNYEAWIPKTPLVHVDTRPCDVSPEIPVAAEVVGNPRIFLERLKGFPRTDAEWDASQLKMHRRKLRRRISEVSDPSTFGPVRAMAVLRELLPDDAVLTCDVGAHTHLLGQFWTTPKPGLFLMTNGWSSMGFGIPAAMAAQKCRPNQPVVCVTGDGGFLMMAGEILTARRMELPIVIVVLSDQALSLIRVKEAWRRMPPAGVHLHEGDLFGADVFLGVPVFRADCPESFRWACERALSEEGPSIVQATVDGTEYDRLIARTYQ